MNRHYTQTLRVFYYPFTACLDSFLGISSIVYGCLLFGSPLLNLFWESLFCIIGQMLSTTLSDVLNSEVNSLLFFINVQAPSLHPSLPLSHCLANPSSWAHVGTHTHVLVCGISMTTSMWNSFPFAHSSSHLHFICMICKQPVAFACDKINWWWINCHDAVSLSLSLTPPHPPCHFTSWHHVCYHQLSPFFVPSKIPRFPIPFFPLWQKYPLHLLRWTISFFSSICKHFSSKSSQSEHLIGATTLSLLFLLQNSHFHHIFYLSFIYLAHKHGCL